ncbi:TPA: hypothetical protein ACH3X3_004634 [Trebouxia sp. C0006]
MQRQAHLQSTREGNKHNRLLRWLRSEQVPVVNRSATTGVWSPVPAQPVQIVTDGFRVRHTRVHDLCATHCILQGVR